MPLTPKQSKRILLKKVNKTLKDLRRGEKSTVKSILGDLRRTRIEISNTLKGVERFQMPYYRAMLSEINEKIDAFTERMQGTVGTAQEVSFNAGASVSDDIFKTVGLTFGIPAISEELIVAQRELTADLVSDVTEEMRRDISRSLRRSIMVGENQFQAARGIDKIIGVNKKKGYMNRSDKIARTEIGRTFSVARQAKDEQVAEIVPEMKKQWITSQDERVRPAPGVHPSMLKWNHRAAHEQIRNVNEPFRVAGEDLMFPRDPAGSPENTINCRCTSVPYMEEWE